MNRLDDVTQCGGPTSGTSDLDDMARLCGGKVRLIGL